MYLCIYLWLVCLQNNKLPPPPAFIFLIDVSYNAVKSGMVNIVCQELKTLLDCLPRYSSTHLNEEKYCQICSSSQGMWFWFIYVFIFLIQGESRSGICSASGFCHLQQGFALLQRQVELGPAPDDGGVRRVRHVCTPAWRVPGECKWKQTSYREVISYKVDIDTWTNTWIDRRSDTLIWVNYLLLVFPVCWTRSQRCLQIPGRRRRCLDPSSKRDWRH